ncbi:MAG: 2-Phospho-l-lactate Guanylyltransferase,CofC [Rhodospirillales bacterium]|nr:2-Phospho-l-lactate Guanylyltransferase,CofC [Rhodospirillales bacterium]
MSMPPIWAVVPVKKMTEAKQRLDDVLSAEVRQQLAVAMLEDVLHALAAVSGLAGIALATADIAATGIAHRFGASVWRENARDGHSAAVAASARRLAAQGAAMLTIPGDIPLVQPDDLEAVLKAARGSPSFTIVPAHDERGSNAVLCAPANVVELRFGDDSFLPHVAAAETAGTTPTVLRLPRIALDLDRPEDLAAFMRIPSKTRTRRILEAHGVRAKR